MEKVVNAVQLGLKIWPVEEREKILYGLSKIIPERIQVVLKRVEPPLHVLFDSAVQKPFLCSLYNKCGTSYRSPFSNQFFPPLAGDSVGFSQPTATHELECYLNELLDAYRHAYYDGGVSSAYLWSRSKADGFGIAFLLHKDLEEDAFVKGGFWDSVITAEIYETQTEIHYKLLNTVTASFNFETPDAGSLTVGVLMGLDTEKMTRPNPQKERAPNLFEKESNPMEDHMRVIGPALEEAELSIRRAIENILIPKAIEMLHSLRNVEEQVDFKVDFQQQLQAALRKRSQQPTSLEVAAV